MAAKPQLKKDTAESLRAITGFVGDDHGRVFHRLLNHRVRLGILSCLVVSTPLTFSELKHLLETTDGNLSMHARKLETAGYVASKKRFDARMPKTEYAITASGRKALSRYLRHMEALIQATTG